MVAYHKKGNRKETIYVNDQIKAPRMLLIDETGERVGVFPRQKVVAMSQERGKDIVQLHYDFNEKVATVKLVDLGKYLYEKQKADKEKKKQQKKQQMKQIKFRYSIGDNDFEMKMRKVREFLEDGNSVKISVRLRGREKIYGDKVVERLKTLIQEFSDISKPSSHEPKQEPSGYMLVLFPKGR